MPGKFTYKYEADGNTQDVMIEPMFAAIASRRQAADEHGQKPQNTAAGKSRQEHAETQQESFQQAYHFLPRGPLHGTHLFTSRNSSATRRCKSSSVLHWRRLRFHRGHNRRFYTPRPRLQTSYINSTTFWGLKPLRNNTPRGIDSSFCTAVYSERDACSSTPQHRSPQGTSCHDGRRNLARCVWSWRVKGG